MKPVRVFRKSLTINDLRRTVRPNPLTINNLGDFYHIFCVLNVLAVKVDFHFFEFVPDLFLIKMGIDN
jgi:hypothetical protein